MEEVEEIKTRSFRYEDYNTRRVFLRSYPLQWENDDCDEEAAIVDEEEMVKLSLKSRFIAIFHWGEDKVILLKKIKNKVAFYLVSCQPFSFKSSKKRINM